MRALPYLVMLVGAVATFVKVRMSVRRAGRAPEAGPARELHRDEPDVAIEERHGVRSARTPLGRRGRS